MLFQVAILTNRYVDCTVERNTQVNPQIIFQEKKSCENQTAAISSFIFFIVLYSTASYCISGK